MIIKRIQIFWSYLLVINLIYSEPISEYQMASKSSKESVRKLRELGYAFNSDGCLRKIDEATGEAGEEPFEFEVSSSHAQNQEQYEKLAEQIPEIVYDLLEDNGLTRTYVPENLPKEEATFIFTQPEKLSKSKKLLVLIHGSGFVRAGQWARSLIINNSINHGTQIPYVMKARSLGYDILITNTNDNYRSMNGVMKAIPGHNSPTAHAANVWEKYVMGSDPESVAIVAHSYGGPVTMELAKRFSNFFKTKVFAVAFTDSAHYSSASDNTVKLLKPITCNWVSSDKPLDTKLKDDGIQRVSAGHSKHEWTSYSAISSVFDFLESKHDEFIASTREKKPKLDL